MRVLAPAHGKYSNYVCYDRAAKHGLASVPAVVTATFTIRKFHGLYGAQRIIQYGFSRDNQLRIVLRCDF